MTAEMNTGNITDHFNQQKGEINLKKSHMIQKRGSLGPFFGVKVRSLYFRKPNLVFLENDRFELGRKQNILNERLKNNQRYTAKKQVRLILTKR